MTQRELGNVKQTLFDQLEQAELLENEIKKTTSGIIEEDQESKNAF